MIKSKKIRISFMNMDEVLLTRAEGMATNGSINVDGSSSVRRTCQLNFVSNELKPVNYFELYKTKFLLEIDFGRGFKKQGIYLLTSFSTSISTNNYTFNISGKDKMCLLNGEHGGSFPFSIDVGTQEKFEYNFEPLVEFEYAPGKYYYQDEGNYVLDYSPYGVPNRAYYKRLITSQKEKLTIKEIINNIVVVYGKEQKHNIFINDLEIKGLELLEYRGSDPLYLFRDLVDGKIVGMTIDGSFEVDASDLTRIQLKEIPENRFFSTSKLIPVDYDPIRCQLSTWPRECHIIRIQYGEPIGYRDTDLTYAGELTANINENVVSILDKIKNMLGNYEYFYDEEGRFIFQKRQDYVSNQFSTIGVDGLGMEYQLGPIVSTSTIDLSQVASIGQNPQFQNIKNDFSIWGTRSGESGSLPIHSRIAIHQKPTEYTTFDNVSWKVVNENSDNLLSEKIKLNEDLLKIGQNGQDELYRLFLDNIPNTEQIKEKYLLFYSNFIANLSLAPSAITAERYYAFLHWVYTICEILDFINFGGEKIQIEEWTKWEANPGLLLDAIFQALLTKEAIKEKDFGTTIVNLIESEIDRLEWGGIKYVQEDYQRDSLVNDLNNYSQKNICYPDLSVSEKKKIEKTVYFLTQERDTTPSPSNSRRIPVYTVGRCPTKNLNSIESFEISSIYNFLMQQMGNNKLGSKYNTELCSNVFKQIGLSYYSNNHVNQILGRCLPLSYTYMDEQENINSSVQMDFISKANAIQAEQNQLQFTYDQMYNDRKQEVKVSDWREILYQMAKDYYDNGSNTEFWSVVNKNNNNQYLSWKTGYEAFYEDILGFWRQLYFDPLYEPLDYELPIGYSLEDYIDYNGWHRDVFENPNGLNFWIDFIEPQGELSAYAIDKIGVKGKYENSSTVKSISVKQPPAVKVLTNMEWELLGEKPDPNYTYIQLEGVLANSYTQSAQGISALERTQNLLFNHTYLQESVTLSIIPDENLTINSRIKLNLVNVQGEYTVSKITLPLAYNGMMSVTLTKIPPTLTTEIIIKEFE